MVILWVSGFHVKSQRVYIRQLHYQYIDTRARWTPWRGMEVLARKFSQNAGSPRQTTLPDQHDFSFEQKIDLTGEGKEYPPGNQNIPSQLALLKMFLFRRWNIASHRSLESSLKGIQSPPTMFRTAKFLLSPSAYRWSKTQLQYVTNILHHDNHNSFFFGHNIDIHQVSNMLSVKVTFDRWTKKTTSSVAFLLKESCHFIGRQGCLLQIHSWERCFFNL